MKMNICFATEDFYPEFIGGQGIYGLHFISNLSQNVTVLAEKRAGRRSFWKKHPNVKLVLTPFVFGNQILLAFLEFIFFKIKLSNENFDILHANQLSGLFFVLFKPKNIKKIIISMHSSNLELSKLHYFPLKSFLYKFLIFLESLTLKKADAILFHTQYEKKLITNSFHLKQSTHMIALGILKQNFTKKDKASSKKIVLTVARMSKKKQVQLCVQALSLLYKQGYPVSGIIVGDGREMNYVKSFAAPNTKFLGKVPYSEIKNLYSSADIFVLISTSEGGISIAAMEAASFGLPLILSPEISENILIDGQNGLILNSANPKLLAEKIKLVLEKSDQMGKISSKIAQQYSWKNHTKQTVNFYQQLLEKS